MFKRLLALLLILMPPGLAFAQNNFDTLFTRALEKNAEYAAALKEKEAVQSQVSAAYSNFYPTLEAVGGWADWREDREPAKGYLGYLRGQFNLFNGFKSMCIFL